MTPQQAYAVVMTYFLDNDLEGSLDAIDTPCRCVGERHFMAVWSGHLTTLRNVSYKYYVEVSNDDVSVMIVVGDGDYEVTRYCDVMRSRPSDVREMLDPFLGKEVHARY